MVTDAAPSNERIVRPLEEVKAQLAVAAERIARDLARRLERR